MFWKNMWHPLGVGKSKKSKKHSRASVNSMALNSQGSAAAGFSMYINGAFRAPTLVISKQRLSDCYINKNEITRNFSITRTVFGQHSNRQFPLVGIVRRRGDATM